MGIVLPEGILANQNTRHVRAWLEERCRIRAIVSLPIETFSPYGANVKTCVLFARKRRVEEKQEPDFPVALVRVDSVGYDASGRTADSSELDEAAEAVEAFLGREGW
jgi:type I restriction enzyme M protein